MNTQKESSENRDEKTKRESWPLKLNKALIAIGVIAFGLIVTDRLLVAFSADDSPGVASLDNSTRNVAAANVLSEAAKIHPDKRKSLAELQSLIGSRVVFVSATEPGYFVTEDERRITVGEDIGDATTLAGVTTHQVIFKKSDDLKIFNLPDPIVQ